MAPDALMILTAQPSAELPLADALPGCSLAACTQLHRFDWRKCACSTLSQERAPPFELRSGQASGCGVTTGPAGVFLTLGPSGA